MSLGPLPPLPAALRRAVWRWEKPNHQQRWVGSRAGREGRCFGGKTRALRHHQLLHCHRQSHTLQIQVKPQNINHNLLNPSTPRAAASSTSGLIGQNQTMQLQSRVVQRKHWLLRDAQQHLLKMLQKNTGGKAQRTVATADDRPVGDA
jgi:hypothetical protein